MKLTEAQYAAVRCAIDVLGGGGGGYTQREKACHLNVLLQMLGDNAPTVTATAGSAK